MLAIFATALFARALDPVLPQIAEDFAIPATTVALLATAFALPYALMQPVLGALADIFGKTRLMTLSLTVLIVAALIGALAPNFSILLVSRVMAGIVAGGVFPIALAIAGDLVPVDRRQVAIGRLLAAAMFGNLLGAPSAGAVADMIGWRGIFAGMGALALLAVIAARIGFGRAPMATATKADLASLAASYRAIFRNPLAKICFGAAFAEATCLFGLFPYVAGLLQAAGVTGASIAGIVIAGFALGGIVYSATVSRLLAYLGEPRLMVCGGLLMSLALGAVALRLPWPIEFVDFVALGLGFYMLHGVIQIYATELAPRARGTAMALHAAAFFLGQAVGPVAYGLALSRAGLTATVVTAGLVLLGVALVCAKRLRRA